MELTQYIANLLLKNNCVIIPGFGGFIANYQPAVIDELRQKIYPPTKQVLFNSNLISNDGLLANYVAQKINTTYPNALSLINNDVELWKKELKAGGRIEIGEIGFLYLNNQQIKFEQNKTYNLLLSAYGLSEIQFIISLNNNTTEKTVTTNKITPKVSEKKPKQPITIPLQKVVTAVETEGEIKKNNPSTKVIDLEPKKRKKNWKYIAVACALPLLFYSYWIPMNTNILETGTVKVSDFNPFGRPADKTYKSRDNKTFDILNLPKNKTWHQLIEHINPNVKVYNYQLDEDLYIPVLLSHSSNNNNKDLHSKNTTVSQEVVSDNFISKTEEKEKFSNKNIHLISGCFSDKQNANNFVKELKTKGYNAHIVDKNKGLYRVSAQSFSSKSDAKLFKDKLANDGYSSWILNK